MNEINDNLFGWKKISSKIWKGNGKNIITIKKLKNKFKIQLYTQEYGFESDEANYEQDALNSVIWFMKRRPQNTFETIIDDNKENKLLLGKLK